MNSSENLLSIVRALYKRCWAIIGLAVLTAVITAGFSLMMPNWYRGTTLFYAASPDLAKPTPIGVANERIEYYGDQEDVDRIFSIANSGQIAHFAINHFNLLDQYEIDSSNVKSMLMAQRKFSKSYHVKKTEFGAIELSFDSKNPILARDVTNNIRDMINTVSQKVIKDAQKKQILEYTRNIDQKKKEQQSILFQLDSIKQKYGIFDVKEQTKLLAEILTASKSNVNTFDAQVKAGVRGAQLKHKNAVNHHTALVKEFDNYNKGFATVTTLQDKLSEANNQLNIDEERYKMLKSKFDADFDAIHVIEFATKPVEKIKPRRSMLVIGSFITALFLLSLAAIVFEFYKKVDWKTILHDA